MSADIELSRRAMACKHWRWMAGMLAHGRSEMHFGTPPCTARLIEDRVNRWVAHPRPDLADPATQGCILALIAEHNHRGSMWDALGDVHHRMGRGLSLPEALVEALESCP